LLSSETKVIKYNSYAVVITTKTEAEWKKKLTPGQKNIKEPYYVLSKEDAK